MKSKRITFVQAKARFVNRFTCEHVPQWAKSMRFRPEGLDHDVYYAPQYASDLEWYNNTTFPGEEGHIGGGLYCLSSAPTWPKGKYLEAPYTVGR